MSSVLRAAVFDLDGVLIDSERWSWQAHDEVLARFHLAPLSLDEVRMLVGLDAAQEWPALLSLRPIPVTHEEYLRLQRTSYVRIRDAGTIAMPGALTLLKTLAAHDIKLGLASNSRRSSIESALHRLAVREIFAAVSSVEDVLHGKPAPDVYRNALDMLGVDRDAAFAVEDSAVGVAAARGAGLFVIAVPNDLTAALDFSHADLVLPDLHAVTSWFLAAISMHADGASA